MGLTHSASTFAFLLALLDFDGDADADIKCEQASWKTSDEMHRIFQIAQLQRVPSAVS